MIVTLNKGAGLIEILIALTVLAVGLLGVLSLQASGLNSGQRAVFATEASLLAEDMAERILAFGSNGATLSEFNGTDTTAPPVFAQADCDLPNTCTPAQQVLNDQNEWASLVNGVAGFAETSLPSVRGDVAVNGAGDLYTISIRWDDERTGWDDERTGLAAGTIANDCTNAATSNARDAAGNLVSLSCFQMEVSVQ